MRKIVSPISTKTFERSALLFCHSDCLVLSDMV